MKPLHNRLVALSAVIILCTLNGRADANSYAQIIKERDSVLTQILAERESRRTTGLGDEEAIAAAQIALYSFRRDVATTSAEKIKNQELIIPIYQKNLELVKAKMRSGLATGITLLEATDRVLEAKQILEELRLNIQHKTAVK